MLHSQIHFDFVETHEFEGKTFIKKMTSVYHLILKRFFDALEMYFLISFRIVLIIDFKSNDWMVFSASMKTHSKVSQQTSQLSFAKEGCIKAPFIIFSYLFAFYAILFVFLKRLLKQLGFHFRKQYFQLLMSDVF